MLSTVVVSPSAIRRRSGFDHRNRNVILGEQAWLSQSERVCVCLVGRGSSVVGAPVRNFGKFVFKKFKRMNEITIGYFIIDKSKMAASKIAEWSLKWLYLSYYTTQKCDVLGFIVQ